MTTTEPARVLRRLAVPVGVTVVVLVAVWLWRPNVITSTFGAPRAIGFVVLAVVVAAGVRVLVQRWTGSAVGEAAQGHVR